jgi:hypothetical protein
MVAGAASRALSVAALKGGKADRMIVYLCTVSQRASIGRGGGVAAVFHGFGHSGIAPPPGDVIIKWKGREQKKLHGRKTSHISIRRVDRTLNCEVR